MQPLIPENPCRYCKEPVRHVGCHSECEGYKAWREKHREVSDARWKDRQINVVAVCEYERLKTERLKKARKSKQYKSRGHK